MVPKQLALLLCTALGAIAAPSAQSDGALEVPQEPQESALPTHPLQDQLHYQEEGDCDGRWMKIGKLLLSHFVKENGECTESARQCIRLPFHDCFPDGGCDGSILLTDECSSRRENAQLIPMCEVLSTLARQYHVGAADLINFAGSLANKACPYGPFIPFYVGRRDNNRPPPTGQLPPPTFEARRMIDIFGRRGFSPKDLVALVGAHSAAYNGSGFPMDSTPGALDSCEFYPQVAKRQAPAILPSDYSLATSPLTREYWMAFGRDQEWWNRAYVEGMIKMITQGNDRRSLTDCSGIIHELCS